MLKPPRYTQREAIAHAHLIVPSTAYTSLLLLFPCTRPLDLSYYFALKTPCTLLRRSKLT